MTLGPKFFCCSKMAVTRRRSKLWWRKAHQSKTLVELQPSRRSERDLKPSGTQKFQNVGPCGHIRGTLLQNIQKCWPQRVYQGSHFTKYSNFLAPAGILREPFYKIVKIVVASVASCRVGRRVLLLILCSFYCFFIVFTFFPFSIFLYI